MNIDLVLPLLRCPLDHLPLTRAHATLRCHSGHAFDLARQGYVNLLVGSPHHTGDTAAMVAARDEFLRLGHYAPFADAVVETVGSHAPPGPVVDLAAGTGWYLARVLDANVERFGIAIDVSTSALRRAARVHARAAAIGADAWNELPMVDDQVAAVTSIFGPRSTAEIGRVLKSGGIAVVVSAGRDHLARLRASLGLLAVDSEAAARRQRAFGSFTLIERQAIRVDMSLTRTQTLALAGMGPSAFHVEAAELRRRVDALSEPIDVTAAATLEAYRM